MSTTTTAAPPAQEAPEVTKRRRRLPVRFIVFGIVALIVGVAFLWLLSWYSPVPVRDVTVTGAGPVKQKEVLAAAGIADGTPIRDIDVAGVAERVAAVPGIETVEIILQRPFTVDLQVSQRFPFAVAKAGEAWVVLDQLGRPISEVPTKPAGLPEVGSADGAPVTPGVVALAALPPDVRPMAKGVLVGADGRVGIVLNSGVAIDWGTTGQDELKGRTVARLLQFKPKQINVSVPERPALTGNLQLPKANRLQTEAPVS